MRRTFNYPQLPLSEVAYYQTKIKLSRNSPVNIPQLVPLCANCRMISLPGELCISSSLPKRSFYLIKRSLFSGNLYFSLKFLSLSSGNIFFFLGFRQHSLNNHSFSKGVFLAFLIKPFFFLKILFAFLRKAFPLLRKAFPILRNVFFE